MQLNIDVDPAFLMRLRKLHVKAQGARMADGETGAYPFAAYVRDVLALGLAAPTPRRKVKRSARKPRKRA